MIFLAILHTIWNNTRFGTSKGESGGLCYGLVYAGSHSLSLDVVIAWSGTLFSSFTTKNLLLI